MPFSFLSENLKPIISVQNFLLRSISLTLKTTWPIFFILMGVFSSAIKSSFVYALISSNRYSKAYRSLQSFVYHVNGVEAKHRGKVGYLETLSIRSRPYSYTDVEDTD